MSGTRSRSHPEPVTDRDSEALLIVAHGDCGGEGGNVLANELARRLRSLKIFDEVAVGFIHGQPSIEDSVARIGARRVRIFPLFMCDGYYVRDAIPQRLGLHDGAGALGHHITMGTPLGLLPDLPGVLIAAATDAASAAGITPAAANLLIVAHGSASSSHSADTARRVAGRIANEQALASVEVAFLEEEPFFCDRISTCQRPVIVLGFFAGGGAHAEDDVRTTVRELNDKSVHLVEQLGGYARIIEMIISGQSFKRVHL